MKKLQRKAKTEPGSDKEPKEERRAESPHSDHSKLFPIILSDDSVVVMLSLTIPLLSLNPEAPDPPILNAKSRAFRDRFQVIVPGSIASSSSALGSEFNHLQSIAIELA